MKKCLTLLAGFTLVELLVTTSLMALAGGAMVAALAGGIRVWERSVAFGTRQEFVLIGFNWLQRDLHGTRRFAKVPFEGSSERCTFAAIGPDVIEGEPVESLGALGYHLNARDHVLCRAFVPYRRLRRERVADECQNVLEGVSRVRFGYFVMREDTGEPGWVPRWKATEPPMAVKIEVTVQEEQGPPTTHTLVVSVADPPDAEEAKQ